MQLRIIEFNSNPHHKSGEYTYHQVLRLKQQNWDYQETGEWLEYGMTFLMNNILLTQTNKLIHPDS